jgi:hypothetical protein
MADGIQAPLWLARANLVASNERSPWWREPKMRATADAGARRSRFRLVNLTRRAAACGLAYLWSFEISRVVYGTNDGKCG